MTMAADSLAGLARELDGMPRASRRAILSVLTPDERAALDRRLAGLPGGSVPSGDAPEHSPWLADRIAAAGGDGSRDGAIAMTGASRQALLRSIGAGEAGPPDRTDAPVPGAGRSLFGAVGGLLAPRGRR